MEEKLSVKSNAVEVLDKQLYNRAKKNQHGIIVLSSATDPYLQLEKEIQLTRKILEVILKHRFPVHIITKSDLVLRDLDLLEEINKNAILPEDLRDKLSDKVFITFSFSTLDPGIAKIFEPGATVPEKRLQTMRTVLNHGFHSGVSMMPLLPYITDTGENLDYMFRVFKESGAKYLFPASLSLFGNGPGDSKTLMLRAIEKHYPHLKMKYENFFAQSMSMPGYYSNALKKKTDELLKVHGIKSSLYRS